MTPKKKKTKEAEEISTSAKATANKKNKEDTQDHELDDSLVEENAIVYKKKKKTSKSEKKSTKKTIEKKKVSVREWWSFRRKKKQSDSGVAEDAEESPQLFALHVKAVVKPSGFAGFFKSISYFGMGKYRQSFIQSLALMLNAGLPLVDALKALETEVRAKPIKKMIAKITSSVQSGSTLWRAMENTYFFTPYEIALVHIGEDAGNLAKNLGYLAEQQEKDHALKQQVKMAMIYPTIVLVLMFVIVMGLGIFVLPSLVQVLYSLKVELPLSTRIIIVVTKFFERYGMQVAPGSLLVFIVLVLLTKFTRFRTVTQWCMFRMPGIGRLAKEATIARFGVILGGLIRAGVPLVEALESLVDVTQVVSYKKFYRALLQRITVGDSFSKSFASIRSTERLLPISVQQLIMTGERSGTLAETLLKISSIYEQKAKETAEKLPIILEPVLLLFIGAIVGGIAFSIITPIYSVVGNIGNG